MSPLSLRRLGAADNNGAKAHLVRFDEVPQIAEFRRLVAESVTEHATVFENMIENPTGLGWPERQTATDENSDTGGTQMSGDEVTRAGAGDGRWWAEHKATEDELERLSNWAAQMESDGVDPLETGESASSPYTPAERVYFVLAPEDDGDRTAAK